MINEINGKLKKYTNKQIDKQYHPRTMTQLSKRKQLVIS